MPVTIKRYHNRKLYNTQSKRYITLKGIEDLIKDGQEIIVIDNRSGKDITAVTLSQIIFELEKNYTGFLPLKLLISLVQSGGARIEDIRRNIFSSMSLSHHYDVEIEKRVNLLIERGELTEEAGSQLMEKLLAVNQQHPESQWDIDGKFVEYLKNKQLPTGNDLRELIVKIDKLSQRVDELNNDYKNPWRISGEVKS